MHELASSAKREYTRKKSCLMIRLTMNRPSDGRTRTAIGRRLELTRRAIGLTQLDFARRAGLASNSYNQYENGVNRPQIDAALAIVDAYGITLDWIYLGDPSGLRYELGEAIRALRAVERDT